MFQSLSVLSMTNWAQLNSLGPSLFRLESLTRQLLLKPVSLLVMGDSAGESLSLTRILAVLSCSSWARTENIIMNFVSRNTLYWTE